MANSVRFGRFTLAGTGEEVITGLSASASTLLKAPSSNSAEVEVGNTGFSAGEGYPLSPGEGVNSEALNLDRNIRVRGTAGDQIAFAQEDF